MSMAMSGMLAPAILSRDDGSDVLVDLEFDDEVYLAADKLFGVLEGGGRVVVVVEDEEVDADRERPLLEALGDLVREGHLGALAGEAEAQLLRCGYVAVGAVRGLREVAAMHEGLQDAVDSGLGDSGRPWMVSSVIGWFSACRSSRISSALESTGIR